MTECCALSPEEEKVALFGLRGAKNIPPKINGAYTYYPKYSVFKYGPNHYQLIPTPKQADIAFNCRYLPQVVSIPSSFINAVIEPANRTAFYTPCSIFKERLVQPIQAAALNPANYFFRPYQSVASCMDGFLNGLILPLGTVFYPGAAIYLCLSALGELIMGLGFMLKSLYHLAKGETDLAKKYAIDGFSRILLSPCLLVATVVSAVFEVFRFLTRSIATMIKLVGDYVAPKEQHTTEPCMQAR